MKVFHASFPGHYIGGYAVIVAENKPHAITMLEEELKLHGLDGPKGKVNESDVHEVTTTSQTVHVLSNGDY